MPKDAETPTQPEGQGKPDAGVSTVIDQPDPDLTEEEEWEPLFSEETEFSVAELTGETDESEKKPESGTKKAEPSPPSDEKAEEKETQKPEEKPEEAKPDEQKEPPKDEKPPPGYVPLQALHEERDKRRELADQVRELTSTVNELREKKEPAKEETEDEEDFKVLTDEEYDELAEDDPPAAIKYSRDLRKHEKKQAEKAKAKEADEEYARLASERVNSCIERIQKAVPGIYDENQDVNDKLFTFVEEHGFDTNFINLMTDPGTRVVLSDKNGKPRVFPLAEGAASFVEMVHKLYQKVNGTDASKIREEMRAEVEKELRDKITKDVLEKMQSSGDLDFTSLGELPGSEKEPVSGFISEAQWARMSEDERKEALGG